MTHSKARGGHAPSVSSLLRIHPRFMRSVQLERDILDPSSSLGYILTPVARQALERIISSFRANSTQRAWRISGDYGSGKTDLALALARIAGRRKEELPQSLRPLIGKGHVRAIMATGDNEPLAVTIMRALARGRQFARRGPPSPDEVLVAVRKEIAKARNGGAAGILLIIDELGKNLEYAARQPDQNDLFLLQRLAEEAARSGKNLFVLVTMLHQAIAAYTNGLDSAAKREWDKVAGRLEEIVFVQPIEQVALLVAATLNTDTDRLPNSLKRESSTAMENALRLGLYGSSAARSLAHLGPSLFPIHPTVLPVLVRAMRRFGQNERSLFSFISSGEPMALQHHGALPLNTAGHYRTHHLFDYLRNNLLPTLTGGISHTHWGVVEAVLASNAVASAQEEEILKTVALLSVIDAADLPATEDFIVQAVASGEAKLIKKALKGLRLRNVIYERGTARGLCLWPHTSVSLHEAFATAAQATAPNRDSIKALCERIRSEHLVPRGYYARIGTLRYAEVSFAPVDALEHLLLEQPSLDGRGPDLNLRVILPADSRQKRLAEQRLRQEAGRFKDGFLIGVAQPPRSALSAFADLIAWEWVMANTPHLSGDRYAREEATRQLAHARQSFRVRLGGLDNLAVPGGISLLWYSNQGGKLLTSGRELLKFLEKECQRIYPDSPRVLNELINRRNPSGAAAAARTKLAEAMVTAPSKPNLGMDDSKRPAEMALYLSILKEGRFHIKKAQGWQFNLPPKDQDKCNLLPAISAITAALKVGGTDAMIPVQSVLDILGAPPFGIRKGLQPFVLAIYLATHHQHVAIYEDGTFLHAVGGNEFARLLKEPQCFRLQYCALEGLRFEVFARLLELMKIAPRDTRKIDLIDLVRPMVAFIGREVPEYARKTSHLSAIAVAVRRVLLEAREPIRLVFTSLPEACGFQPISADRKFKPDEFAAQLSAAMHEIRTAYPNLLQRLAKSISAAFDVYGTKAHGRAIISARATQLAVAVTDPSIKAFSMRLCDTAHGDKEWIESIANLLARKSPERWTDGDETEFHHQLEVAAQRFKRIELALVGTTKTLNGHACRIALTKSDGTEVGDLVDWDGMQENRIRPIEEQVARILSRHGQHGLAGAMRAIWTRLEESSQQKKHRI
jgi:hypothetical protein